MENSIEVIWKQGFLNESSLVAPKINDLYNQKSIQVVDRIKRKIKNQRTFALMLVLLIPVIYYFVGAFWQGVAFSTMGLFMLWYTRRIINSIKTLDQGATSYDYLKSFDSCLKGIFLKSEKIVQYSLPLYCSIGYSALWSAWSKFGVVLKLQHKYPNINITLVVLVFLVTNFLLVILFSVKMHRWEVRITYGRLFDKLKETIADMEKLKHGE